MLLGGITVVPQASPMLPPNKYKRRLGWVCHIDSALYQITLIFVNLCRGNVSAFAYNAN